MNQVIPSQQPEAVLAPTMAELRYYYFGFYKALKNYRTMTLLGWSVVATGCACSFLVINAGRNLGPFGIVLTAAVIIAGLGLVWQSISTLESYLRIALPSVHEGDQSPVVVRVEEIMKEVDDGGWQEAYAAIRKLEELRTTYELPPLER